MEPFGSKQFFGLVDLLSPTFIWQYIDVKAVGVHLWKMKILPEIMLTVRKGGERERERERERWSVHISQSLFHRIVALVFVRPNHSLIALVRVNINSALVHINNVFGRSDGHR